jgi:hypothetical protein
MVKMNWLSGQRSRQKTLNGTAGIAALVLVIGISVPGVRGAAPTASRPRQVSAEQQIEALERKLLQRTYPLDLEDKRLQRLECLVFGATQEGTLQERWEALKRATAQPSAPQTTGSNRSLSSRVAEVETQVLKKTNPTLPMTARLDQLEAKVFGQTSPNMPLPQRVERLRKTIGLTDPFNSPQTAIQPFGSMPNGSSIFRFNGDPYNLDPRQMDPQTSQMMNEINRQMKLMERIGDGMLDGGMREFTFPNAPNGFPYEFSLPNPQGISPYIEIVPGSPGKPGAPGSGGKPGQPGKPGSPGIIFKSSPTQEIPPYGAPDTI